MYPGNELLPFCLTPAENGVGSNGTTRHSNDLTNTVEVFVSGALGVRFESLVLFAEPVFDLYGLNLEDALRLRDNARNADESSVAALEAARLFWAFFTLDPEEQAQHQRTLTSFLLGPEYSDEDEEEFTVLFDRMTEQWNMLSDEERVFAEEAPIGFTALLEHPVYAGSVEEADDDDGGYGPNNLSTMEAKAYFAQPLLNSVIDIDELERAMERANVYWDLAHKPEPERQKHIPTLIKSLASSPSDRKYIETELLKMLERFDSIFPGHS